MAKQPAKKPKVSRRPPLSPEEHEKHLIGLAYDLAEKQLKNGTASPSVVAYLLKMGSRREEIEERHLEKKVEHMDVQIEHIKATEHAEEIYRQALEAMKRYSGTDDEEIF